MQSATSKMRSISARSNWLTERIWLPGNFKALYSST